MAEVHLSQTEFLSRLSTLFTSTSYSNHSRSLFLTQKRLSPPNSTPSTDPLSDLTPPEKPFPILVRATNGKSGEKKKDKIKISTIVQEDELEAFFARYADVCKMGMGGLKKRDKAAQKAKAKAKKEKERKARGEGAG